MGSKLTLPPQLETLDSCLRKGGPLQGVSPEAVTRVIYNLPVRGHPHTKVPAGDGRQCASSLPVSLSMVGEAGSALLGYWYPSAFCAAGNLALLSLFTEQERQSL